MRIVRSAVERASTSVERPRDLDGVARRRVRRRAGSGRGVPATSASLKKAPPSPARRLARASSRGAARSSPARRTAPSGPNDLHVAAGPAELRAGDAQEVLVLARLHDPDGDPGDRPARARRARRRPAPRSWLADGEVGDDGGDATATATATAAAIVMRGAKAHALAQGVADAADGLDQARPAARLGLAAQVADVDVERVRARSRSRSPRRARR